MVEEQDSQKQDHDCGSSAVGELQDAKGSITQEGVPESLYDWGHGVDEDQPAETLGHRRQWVDDRRCVHDELDPEANQHLEVAVPGGERRHDNAGAQAQGSHEQEQEGSEQDEQVGLHGGSPQAEEGHEGEQEQELDAELHQVRDDHRQRDREPGEVDLSEDGRVGDKGA